MDHDDNARADSSSGFIHLAYDKFIQEYSGKHTAPPPEQPVILSSSMLPLPGQLFFAAASAPDLEEEVADFQGQHHVAIKNDHGKFDYSLHFGGQDHLLFQTAASEAGLKDASQKLAAMVTAEESDLNKEFHVTFAKSGDDVDFQKPDADSSPSAHMVKARDPELFELEGIKSALQQSLPSNIGADGHTGVKFYCLTEKQITGIDPLATFQMDRSGNPSVYLWPAMSDLTRVTEQDLTAKERSLSWVDRHRPDSLEGAITHELGHHQFAKLGYNANAKVSEVDRDLSPSGAALVQRMGWVRRLDEKDADYNWLLEGKHKDLNGNNASYLPESNGLFFEFMRKQKEGGIVNSAGKVVPADQGQRLSEDAMRQEAVIKPPTWYFEAPEEEYAESVKLFRLGGDNRKALLDDSRTLYAIIKQNDQREIDQAYGKNADGTSKLLRDLDGHLVPDTAANRKRIAAFESGN